MFISHTKYIIFFMISWLKNKFRNNKLIIQNAGYLSIIEVVRMVMPFVALPYVIATIGGEKYGLAVFAQTIVTYFTIFINWGLDISAVRDISVNRNNPNELNKIVSTVLGIKLILFLFFFFFLLLCLVCIPFMRDNYCLFLFAFITCISEVLFPVWFYQGIEKMKYLTIIRTTSIVFYTLTVFVFIHTPNDYEKVVLLQSLGNVLAGCLSVYLLFVINKIRLIVPNFKYMLATFKQSFPFFMSRLSVVFNNTMAKTISGIFFTMESVAAFDLAQKIATAALIPTQMMNQAVYPHIAKTRSVSFVRKYFNIDVLLSFSVASLVAVLSPFLISILSKGQLPEAISLLYILCIWVFLGGVTTYIGSPVLVSFGYPKPFNISVILSTVTLLLSYALCYVFDIFSIYNFAWILVISEFIILLYRMYYCVHLKLINGYD